MVMHHVQFAGMHRGEDVWVVGSGRTLDFVDPSLFRGKVVIGVNGALHERGGRATYWVSNHHHVAVGLARAFPSSIAVTPTDEPVPPEHRRPVDLDVPNIVTAPVIAQHYARFDPYAHWPDDRWRLPVGPSSATLALGWAQYVGARTIILVGLDCGRIDGLGNSVDHRPHTVPAGEWEAHQHHGLWERVLVRTAQFLRESGVHVYSLNPWATLGLEGHEYTREA